MINRFLLIIILLFISFAMSAQSRDFSHWSFAAEGGVNLFDGDVNQKYNSVLPTSLLNVSWGGAIEYTLNPKWGVGFGYYFLPLNAGTNTKSFWSKMNNMELFVDVNLLNLFYDNLKTKWGIWAFFGVGMSFYNSQYSVNQLLVSHIPDGRALCFPAGLQFEYNLSRSLALGTKFQLRTHNKDNIEGKNIFQGVTNDYAELATISLRYKLGALKKAHVRNVNFSSFKLNEVPSPVHATNICSEKQLDSIKNEIDRLKPQVDSLKRELNSINQFVRNGVPGTDYQTDLSGDGDGDGDGVPNGRDREMDTPPNSVVDYWGRKIDTEKFSIKAIYFDLDKAIITEESHRILHQIAFQMKMNPNLLVEIRGYADNIGKASYNILLSLRRAETAKLVLVNQYGIQAGRIIANGYGKITIPPTAFRMNRRCDFFFNE